jgi:hypothetical protein
MTDQGLRNYDLPLAELPLGIRVEAVNAIPSAMISGFAIWKPDAAQGISVPLELSPVADTNALTASLNDSRIAKGDTIVFHIQANFGLAPADKRYKVTFSPTGNTPVLDTIITVSAPIQTPTYMITVS